MIQTLLSSSETVVIRSARKGSAHGFNIRKQFRLKFVALVTSCQGYKNERRLWMREKE
jgi:hypothetical protein